MSLSVCIITLDEEVDLPRCLASVAGLADEVIVVDSGSTDRTQAIATDAGATVIERPFTGHVDQKQFALEQAGCDWVLSLDADEWLDDTLREAVRAVVTSPATPEGEGGPQAWEVDRYTQYLGAWIDHGGWSPQWKLRLVRRNSARWGGTDPHDHLFLLSVEGASGAVARLSGRLCHIPYRSLSDHVGKVNKYTDIMVDRQLAEGASGSWLRLVANPPARFLKMYVLRLGVLDGWRGLVLAGIGGFYVFLKYAKLLARARPSA